VFCANDDLALGVLFECRRREIVVPEQIAIVGFNDLEFMASAVPTLTSVRTNRYEMGKTAATMLIEAIDGRRPEQPVLDLGFKVVERQSSASRRPDNRPAASGAGAVNKMVALPSSHD
jgi:LacI family gluconate utilization system Gnt-I transcriptional repressor